MESLRKRAVDEVLRSEKSYLRHLEIIQVCQINQWFM